MLDTEVKAASSFTILPVTEVPEEDLLAFYQATYPARTELFRDHWRWLYRVGEQPDEPVPLVAWADGRVVGHIGTMPTTLVYGNDVRRATWDMDYAVAPEYQRQKLGTRLIQGMMDQAALHVAFGNEKSVATLVRIGWRVLSHTRSFQLLLRPEYHPKLRQTAKGALTPLVQLGGVATRTIWRARALTAPTMTCVLATAESLAAFPARQFEASLQVLRTPEFWAWRVLQHPGAAEHFILHCQTSAATTYQFLVRLSTLNGFRRLHILSLWAPSLDAEQLSRCFAGIVQWSLKEGIHRILFVTSHPLLESVARRWLPITSTLNFLCYAHNQEGWDYLTSTAHHWECADSDLDLSV